MKICWGRSTTVVWTLLSLVLKSLFIVCGATVGQKFRLIPEILPLEQNTENASNHLVCVLLVAHFNYF
jgi:hypothetical protein